MPIDTYTLTKDKNSLARILHLHCTRSESQLMVRRINWMLAWYYMNGYRRFDTYNPVTGGFTPFYMDRDNKMEYQSQQLLYAINQLAGRFQAMDCMPVATATATSLGNIRNKSTAQITADAIVAQNHVNAAKEQAAYLFTCLGSVGIQGHLMDHPTIGLTSDIEVIHPRELYPFPMLGQDFTKLRGIVRQRMVPFEHMKNVYGGRTNSAKDKMEYYEAPVGEMWTDGSLSSGTTDGTGLRWLSGNRDSTSSAFDTTIEMVRVRELWLLGAGNTTHRYVCASGDHIFEDNDMGDVEAYCPIGFSRFFNNGTFHGAGMFDLMFSIHRELEKLQKSLFENVRKIDKYGILVIPAGQMNQNVVLKDVGEGLRTMFYEPDPIAEGFNPFPIQPVNSGDFPGKVAQHAAEVMGSINPIRDLIEEKGRIDSASGLQFLDEQMNKAITTPTLGIEMMWSNMYKSLVQRAAFDLARSQRALPVKDLTLDLAGAVIDPKESTVSFKENPIPDVSKVHFTIKSSSPKSPTARKQEAIQLWQTGVERDPVNFRLFCMKEGLDVALYLDDDAGAYESTVRMILQLYNDGETPGFIAPSPHTTKPDLALRILSGFMTKPLMQMASPEVVNAFRSFREALMQFAGISLPEAVPNPDDAAMLSGGMPGMQGPPGMPVSQGPPPM
jgi:hypothetical protein